MDKVATETPLNKLEEFINDEDKIVTVPWLCIALNINPKDSKRLLEQYVTKNRKVKPTDFAVTYTISGICNDMLSMSVVKEDELDDKKDLYTGDPIVEIYSVQKSKEISLHGIALVDYFDVHNPREKAIQGSLISKNCTLRQFKAKKALPAPPAPVLKEKPSLFSKVPPKAIKPNGLTTQSLKPPTNTKKSTPVQKGSVNSFAAYFTNGQSKSTLEATDAQRSSDLKKSPEKTVPEQKTETQRSLQSLVDSDSEDDRPPTQTQHSTSNGNKAKRTRKKSTKKNNSKRRKRIVVEDESEEDMFANDDDNEEEEEISRKRKNVIVDSDEDEPVMLPEPAAPPKNKRRKLVDRTFEDPDGYVITKKEWVEESASEEEAITEPKVETKKEIKKEAITEPKVETKKEIKKVTSTNVESEQKLKRSTSDLANNKNEKVNGKSQGGKGKKATPINQPTLMNFFKRK